MIVVAAVVLASVFGRPAGADLPLVRPGFSPALVLSGDARDSVAFEADSLVPNPGEILISLSGRQSLHPHPTRMVFLRIRTPGRIAVLVDSAGAPPWTADAARHALLERHATAPAWPHALATVRDGFEFPRDWYRRGLLEVANGFGTPIRVTWVAFDSPSREEIARVAALTSLGLRTSAQGAPSEPIERPQPPSAEALRLTVRIVGSVHIDPRSGRIER